MRHLRRLWMRLAGMLTGGRREDELADEIEFHVRMQTDDNIAAGMTPEEARRAALVKFGGVEAVKESYRDQRGLPAIEDLVRDARYAVRTMRRDPGFSAAGVVTLALGIATATAVFTVVNALLLRPFPYREPERLATVSIGGAMSAPVFETIRRESRSIEGAALFTDTAFNLAGDGEPQRIPGARVSAALFGLLGVQPQLGRTFSPEEDRPGHAVVVISDRLWRSSFGADRGVVGGTARLNGEPYTVVGVMPRGFQFPDGPELPATVGAFPPAQIWRPLALADWERDCAGCFNFAMLARLERGVAAAGARSELQAIVHRASSGGAPGNAQLGKMLAAPLAVRTLQEAVTSQARPAVLLLVAAVVLTVLIACVNVANLLLVRGLRRQAELAVRLSLGAARGRLVRQLLTEALVLALAASALALPLAWLELRALWAIAPSGLAQLATPAFDARAFAFALALGLGTAMLFGLAPAVVTSRRTPAEALKGEGRTSTRPTRIRAALVVAEFALSLVLLVASALLAKSFVRVASTSLGFSADKVVTMRLPLSDVKYDQPARRRLVAELVAACATQPGVEAAAAVSTLPLTGESEGWGTVAEDDPDPENDWVMVRARAVTPGYFQAMGIRLREGRDFTAEDRGTNPAVILSRSAARKLWPGLASPLGRRLRNQAMTVVGIVDDTRASGMDNEVRPYLYVPFAQFAPREIALVVRGRGDPAALVPALQRQVWRLDKDQPVTHVAVMKSVVADSIAPRRFPAVVVTLFAAFALVLGAIGIYGVLSYSVEQRLPEIGIRMALGASRGRVLASVVGEAFGLALAGAAAGLLGALAFAPLLRSLLYGVQPGDPRVLAGCTALLLATALVGTAVPARRALKVDPAASLRHE